MVGLPRSHRSPNRPASSPRLSCRSRWPAPSAMPVRSAPAQKAWSPAPVRTTTRASGSSRISRQPAPQLGEHVPRQGVALRRAVDGEPGDAVGQLVAQLRSPLEVRRVRAQAWPHRSQAGDRRPDHPRRAPIALVALRPMFAQSEAGRPQGPTASRRPGPGPREPPGRRRGRASGRSSRCCPIPATTWPCTRDPTVEVRLSPRRSPRPWPPRRRRPGPVAGPGTRHQPSSSRSRCPSRPSRPYRANLVRTVAAGDAARRGRPGAAPRGPLVATPPRCDCRPSEHRRRSTPGRGVVR